MSNLYEITPKESSPVIKEEDVLMKDIDYSEVFPSISDVNLLPSINVTEDGGITKRILKEGSDNQVTADSTVHVYYLGRTYPEKKVFDAAFSPITRKFDFSLQMGAGQAIPAWELTLATMKVGEISIMRTTPDYAFGKFGCPPRIPGNTILEYHIELIKCITKQPEKKFESVDERIEECVKAKNEGNEHYKKNNFRKASRAYNRALSFFDGLHNLTEEEEEKVKAAKLPLHTNLAACFLKLREYNKVISNCHKALEIDSENLKAIWRLGQGLLETDDIEGAEVNLYRAAKMDPKNADIRKDIEALKERKKLEVELNKLRPNIFTGIFNSGNK